MIEDGPSGARKRGTKEGKKERKKHKKRDVHVFKGKRCNTKLISSKTNVNGGEKKSTLKVERWGFKPMKKARHSKGWQEKKLSLGKCENAL